MISTCLPPQKRNASTLLENARRPYTLVYDGICPTLQKIMTSNVKVHSKISSMMGAATNGSCDRCTMCLYALTADRRGVPGWDPEQRHT
jgi:hypothetical protein